MATCKQSVRQFMQLWLNKSVHLQYFPVHRGLVAGLTGPGVQKGKTAFLNIKILTILTICLILYTEVRTLTLPLYLCISQM